MLDAENSRVIADVRLLLSGSDFCEDQFRQDVGMYGTPYGVLKQDND